MNIKTTVINSFANFVLGSSIFTRVKAVVQRQDDKIDLTGPEKRAAAMAEMQDIGLEIANWAFSLAIELAVTYFRSQAGKSIHL